ncbi:EamA family transporter [Zafaria cholistanensis]|nr:EamA family transporter [Zafaria cholistanensis]
MPTQVQPDVDGGFSSTARTKRDHVAGIATMFASSACAQTGAAAGALAFPSMGPLGVVAVRQLISAVVLSALARPNFRTMTRHEWWPVASLAFIFGAMNLSLYSAVERIGLGLAVTLEFLGPLAVAVCASRRFLDIACALAAATGVLVLTHPEPSSDFLGIGLALLAAVCWAAYILLNRTVGRRMPGLQGTSAANLLSACVWGPMAAVWFVLHPPGYAALGLALACGVLASAVPYAADLLALRRVSASLFGIFMSISPVWAAAAGWVMLGQTLNVQELAGIGIIVLSNVVVSVRPILGRPSHRRSWLSHKGQRSDGYPPGETRRSIQN